MNSKQLTHRLQRFGPQMALMVALTATLGSLYLSEIRQFVPCTLCWYQRILMYPLVIIILVGIIEQDEFLSTYVLPFSFVGIILSTYHYLLQWGVWGDTSTCTVGIPCNIRYLNYFGFITIPFMALVAFTLISLIMWLMKRSRAELE